LRSSAKRSSAASVRAAPLTDLTNAMSLSWPASPAVIDVFGGALLVAGLYLIGLSRHWRAATVPFLAVVNLAGAIAFAGWLAVSWGERAVAGRLVIGPTAVALALLGAVEQARLSRPRPAR
jgi:hypothetical protein